ncbi:cilia- and flagella-associated protein 54-like isoform X2 [Mizuhopecten yessoensis]|uniref:cilia- and flagella-associated protein 54-like isoform X2 n=1 Tax=Mizuhopecten yessoensis TaxID=6573 RepID=UPI000B45C9CB|nr:cilia- and flagella-associated protein 54-like isoform X2 [Mizuhopecten yessoensis]
MAAVLRGAAVASANRGQPSSFYSKDKTNPVFQSLEQETKKFMGYMKKRNVAGYQKPDDEPCSRPADTLFDLWNKYEPKLPKMYYQEKLLEMGDFLMTVQEYSLALWQCYERYLLHFEHVNEEEITDVDTFKTTFFPEGFDSDDAGLTFRALMGKSISMYQVVRVGDPKLQNKQSVDRCVQILSFLRLVMQVVLPQEKLCWLVYNGTIHIYSVSRHMMSLGHSARVIEYLLWASVCMETSVPLLAVKYLPWRATLYTAVCQCYFDCKVSHHAERSEFEMNAFARRGLAKINELSRLESLSSSTETLESEDAFRQATVKMAVMVFRRSAFETRRKPKGLLRPKTRANLKDAQNLPWPRTPSEKLLSDMLEGSAAQFLCILESLNDTNRRTILTSPPAADSEVEILDVYAELFLAGQEILSGGGGRRGSGVKPTSHIPVPALCGVMRGKTLLGMATHGEDGATIEGAIKLVKMAYCFEQWEVFDQLIESVLMYIRIIKNHTSEYAWDEKALELLLAMEKVNPNRRHKRTMTSIGEEDKEKDSINQDLGAASQAGGPTSVRSLNLGDELIHVAEVLITIITGPFKPSDIEVDMVVDTALFLWNKTKAVFQKHQTGSLDNPKYLQRMDSPNKWVYILDVVHQVLGWCGLSSVDPALTAEVVLRLALVLESSANMDDGKEEAIRSKVVKVMEDAKAGGVKISLPMKDIISTLKESKTSLSDFGNLGDGSQQFVSRTSMLSSSMLNVNPRMQLMQAREILEMGLENVSYARQAVALTDGKSIADVSWAKDLNDEVFDPTDTERETTKLTERETTKLTERETTRATLDTAATEDRPNKAPLESVKGSSTAVWNTIKDLHLELILMYHRVCLKLAAMGPDPGASVQRPFKRKADPKLVSEPNIGLLDVEGYKELLSHCNKNHLSKALLFMQRALLLSGDNVTTSTQKALLQDALKAIQKAQTEERRVFTENTNVTEEDVTPTKIPPPPILLCRTDTMMVFKPTPFIPADGQKISWYRIFARSAEGSNVRVRLNDHFLPGTGEQVPGDRSELRVSGLIPNGRYLFAVAAYNREGKLIGESIGQSTKPILASHPLPVLMTWGFLSQIAYQVGCYDIARQACDVLWNHFKAEPPAPQSVTYMTESEQDFKLTLMRLNQKVVCLSSPVLLRQFLTSIFIGVDMSVREGQLFCDVLCDKGPLFKGQMKRLAECERMLVAIELAGWLNEANLALQSVVQVYGLLAPLIFYKIPSVAVIQVLQRCHVVLQEIPAGLRQKRQPNIADSLHHMTASITYHMAKVLRAWGQKQLANSLNESGRKLLALETFDEPTRKDTQKTPGDGTTTAASDLQVDISIDNTDSDTAPLQMMKKKRAKKMGAGGQGTKEDGDGPTNEELKALEAHMLSLSKQAQYDHELTGYEDPSILHAYIAYLPSKLAYREVAKFKRRHRYLEFFVQVAQKALTEGMSQQAADWCDETANWLTRRNEQIIGMKPFLGKQPGAGVVTVTGDDPKRFHAAVVEYNKEKDMTVPKIPGQMSKASPSKSSPSKATPRPKRRRQYKPLQVNPNMTEAARQAQEEAELKAIEKFTAHLPDMFKQWLRRRRLRKLCIDELPWRCQLTLIQGLSHFSSFLHKLETRDKVLGTSSSSMYRTNFLDQEWFTYETAGTLVVGWEGGPTRKSGDNKRQRYNGQGFDESDMDNMDVGYEQEARPRTTATGIEIAAAMATGNAPPPLYFIPPEPEDTPRTYRSDVSNMPKATAKPMDNIMLSSKDTEEALHRTFTYFRRAINLAHRGQHWTLLQNACRSLWNCAHTALLRAFSPNPNTDDGLLSIDQLRGLVWRPFYMAADCVLDMLAQFQLDLEAHANKERKKNRKLGELFESWTGEAKDEKGGANLKFENPLDNLSISDLRWVRRLVMRVMELLYYEQKWEKLVDIALRFSALSNDRYAEQVIPVLVQAQRQLEDQIYELGGEVPPQSHIKLLMQQVNGVITAKKYIHSQLVVSSDKLRSSNIQPGAQIDPLGHGAYTSEDGKRNVSVPLDVPHSLSVLRTVFDKSQYTCHALQHSRRLLVLYLAGQQNSSDLPLSRQVSKVEFTPNTARPQPTMPLDISREEYLHIDDVQTSCMPRSQLGTVISSYEKTIEMLIAKNQRGLAAQAMHELGNLQYHSSNIRSAYQWWAESLDYTLNTSDALHTWRQLFDNSTDVSSDMLQHCGLWGCVLGGVLASKIAQYILTQDLGLRMECCFLSGYFFKALFRSSLPHPTADRDYAMYEVGEGCEVTNLVPGIDLLSDKFRMDGRTLVSSLRWTSEELARGRHNLFVLPLLTLYLHFTTFVCRDLQRCVDGRILKVRILTDMSLFTEAIITLQRLLHGERLPHTGDSNFRQVESKMKPVMFNTAKPITEPANMKLLENLLDKRLPSSLATLYGPHMTCHLALVQAHFFVSLGESIPVIPVIEDVFCHVSTIMRKLVSRYVRQVRVPEGQGSLKPYTMSTMTKNKNLKGTNSMTSKQQKAKSAAESRKDAEDDLESLESAQVKRRFTSSKKPLTLELIKGTLLAVADQMVSTIAEVIQENAEHAENGLEKLPAAELELVVLCKLQQATIARQKQHAPLAARIVLSSIKLLKSSDLFKPKKDVPHPPRGNTTQDSHTRDRQKPSSLKGQNSSRRIHYAEDVKIVSPETNQFQFQNFQSRSRLDARLWLDCRQALVKCLMLQVGGLGQMKVDPDIKVLQELADCRQYCVEGLSEAEACGDNETQADFLMSGAFLNIIEGKSLEHTASLVKDVIGLLEKIPKRSVPSEQLYAMAIVLKTDIDAVEREDESAVFTEKTLNQYLTAQNIILQQMEDLGEKIEHYYPKGEKSHFSAPVGPMRNIYLPHVLRLAQIKLRVGHAMARNAAKYIRGGTDNDPVVTWTHALGVLTTARELSQVAVMREANLEAEILLQLGKVQRMLVYMGKFNHRKAAETLIDSIKISFSTDHDLGLMRQGYLELAQVYLHSVGMVLIKENSTLEFVADSGEDAAAKQAAAKRKLRSKSSAKQENSPSKKERSGTQSSMKSQGDKPDEMADVDKERRAAWTAIRCAAALGQAQRSRILLIGDTSVTSQPLTDDAQKQVPEFIALDLVSDFVLGERKKVYKSQIEEELAPLIEANEVKHIDTYDEQVMKAQEGAKELSWIHFLGYQSILQRLCNTSTISASSHKSNRKEKDPEEEELPEFDLGFISHAHSDTTVNHDMIRSMLFSGMWSRRLTKIHDYLANNLQAYRSECCGIYPPEQLVLPPTDTNYDLDVTFKSYTSNLTVDTDNSIVMATVAEPGEAPLPPGTVIKPYMPSDKPIISPADMEVALQFYQPSLEENDPQSPEASGAESRILLMHAIYKKMGSVCQPGVQWVSLSQLNDLHDRLAVLAQRAEISLVEKKKKDLVAPSPTPASKPKKGQRIKALSPKVERDERLENLLKQCLDDVKTLLGLPHANSIGELSEKAEKEKSEKAEKEKAEKTEKSETGSVVSTELPFEVTKKNIAALESLFDPSFGYTAQGTDIVQWLLKVIKS